MLSGHGSAKSYISEKCVQRHFSLHCWHPLWRVHKNPTCLSRRVEESISVRPVSHARVQNIGSLARPAVGTYSQSRKCRFIQRFRQDDHSPIFTATSVDDIFHEGMVAASTFSNFKAHATTQPGPLPFCSPCVPHPEKQHNSKLRERRHGSPGDHSIPLLCRPRDV